MMDKTARAIEIRDSLFLFVKNFPSFIWQDGSYEGLLPFVETFGEKYASENVKMIRELGLLSEYEISLFLQLEKLLLEHLAYIKAEKPPFWIRFSGEEFKAINAIRKEIMDHFNIDQYAGTNLLR